MNKTRKSIAKFAKIITAKHVTHNQWDEFNALCNILENLCRYQFEEFDSVGMDRDPPIRSNLKEVIPTNETCIMPITWDISNTTKTKKVLKQLSLYSDGLVGVLPNSINAYSAGYSGGGGLSYDQEYFDFLSFNKLYKGFLASGEFICLPKAFKYQADDSTHREETYTLPLLQKSEGDIFIRLNTVDRETQYTLTDYRLFREYSLPYFPSLNFVDTLLVRKNEDGIFSTLLPSIKHKLASLNYSSDLANAKETFECIDERISLVGEKAKSISRKGFFTRHSLSHVKLILSFKEIKNINTDRNIAGILGNPFLPTVLPEYERKDSKIINYGGSFNLPFLILNKGTD